MTTVELSNAVSAIDENILCDILEERYQRTAAEKKTHKPAVFFRRFSLVAAAACLIVAVFALPHFKNQPNNLPAVNPLPTTNPTLPTTQHTPAHSTPSLEEIYAIEPFDKLFPRKILENYVFDRATKSEYDPIANPNNKTTLNVYFMPSVPDAPFYYSLDISISNSYIDNMRFADVANPQSYDLKLYYEETTKNELPVEGDYFPTFLPEDISEELLEHRIYVIDNGIYKASVDIFFEDYVVSYGYTGLPITAAEFYEMITSAQWFQ